MSTESLIVELDARTQRMDAKLRAATRRLDELDGGAKKADSSLARMGETAKKAAKGAAAVATATAALVTQTVMYAKELKIATARNGESIEKMQGLAFATNTVGISLEKLGDIGKDTNEKIGDFLATGGGGFKDFVDVMGLTTSEARVLAEEFETMSGTDVLQEMVRQMEEGGVSAEKMSFALEGMASDTTDLIPLLKDGSKALKDLTKDFDDMNVALTQEDINKITAIGVEFDKMTAKLGGEAKQAVADYAGEIATAIRVTTEFLTTTANVFGVISTGWGNVLALSQAAVTDMVNGTDTFSTVLAERANMSRDSLEQLGDDMVDGVKKVNQAMSDIEGAGTVETESDASNSDSSAIEESEESPRVTLINKELEAIKDRFKSEQQLLAEKYEADKEILDLEVEDLAERNDLKAKLAQELADKLFAIDADRIAKEEKLKSKAEKKQKKLDDILDKQSKDNAKRDEKLAKDGMALASLVFEDNKLVSSGIAFVNTAEGVTKALAKQDYAGAALTAVMGAAQIDAINSASKGGGSVSAPPAPPPISQQTPDFSPETDGLQLTDASASGTQTLKLEIVTDGNELTDAIGRSLSIAQSEGRV